MIQESFDDESIQDDHSQFADFLNAGDLEDEEILDGELVQDSNTPEELVRKKKTKNKTNELKIINLFQDNDDDGNIDGDREPDFVNDQLVFSEESEMSFMEEEENISDEESTDSFISDIEMVMKYFLSGSFISVS